jgi:hypothetical protein
MRSLSVKVKTYQSSPKSTLNEEVKEVLDKLKHIGSNLTFEGEFVSDFIERLDKIIDVLGVRMEGNILKILVGDAKNCDPTQILSVIAKATLLNVSASGYEKTKYGNMIYFEYYIPPWNEFYV